MRKIFITGCSKSGTTLLKRLFYAFPGVHVHAREIYVDAFSVLPIHENLIADVGKRRCKTVFSNTLPQEEIDRQLLIIMEHDISVVNITRNKSEVTESEGWSVPMHRYESAIAQAEQYSDYITYGTTYERLISVPDIVQAEIAIRLFPEINGSACPLWSSYPRFVPDIEFSNVKDARYAARPIGAKP